MFISKVPLLNQMVHEDQQTHDKIKNDKKVESMNTILVIKGVKILQTEFYKTNIYFTTINVLYIVTI